MAFDDPDIPARREWMGILAKAPAGRVATLLDGLGTRPDFTWLRAPEIGSVMLRGRMGGKGALFNMGEMTVTRCALKLDNGMTGHAVVQGREKAHAEAAAIVDAMMQGAQAAKVDHAVLAPLRDELSAAKTSRASKAAATKVEFFTMVRGED